MAELHMRTATPVQIYSTLSVLVVRFALMVGRWALNTQPLHAVLLGHKQFYYTFGIMLLAISTSEWHSGWTVLHSWWSWGCAFQTLLDLTCLISASEYPKLDVITWTLICMTSWANISLVQLLKKSVICTMTAVLPKVQQSSWEHITTLTDNQPHNTFQNFYIHVGHIVRLQSGLS